MSKQHYAVDPRYLNRPAYSAPAVVRRRRNQFQHATVAIVSKGKGRDEMETEGMRPSTYILQILQQVCDGLPLTVGQGCLIDSIPRATFDGTQAGSDMAPPVDGRQTGQTSVPYFTHACMQSRRTRRRTSDRWER